MLKKKLLEYRADLLLLTVAIAWGVTFLMVQDAIKSVPVYSFLFFRFLIASALIFFLCIKRFKNLDKGTMYSGIFLGVLLFSGFSTQTFALAHTKSSIVAFITGLNVIFVPFVSFLLFRDYVRKMVFAGSFIAVIGLYLLTMSGTLTLGYGETLTIVCAMMFALHILFTDKYSKSKDVFLLVFFQFITVTILSMLFSLSLEEVTFDIPMDYTFLKAVIVTSIFATFYAFLIQTYMQQYTTPTKTAIIFTMEPVSAAVYEFVAIGAVLTNIQLVGAFLIVSATLMAEIKFKKE
jgi:drug/metabolite transporter (DMT)-like permease